MNHSVVICFVLGFNLGDERAISRIMNDMHMQCLCANPQTLKRKTSISNSGSTHLNPSNQMNTLFNYNDTCKVELVTL